MELKKRPIKSGDADTERIYSHFDEQLQRLDDRRIGQITKLSSSADSATVIAKLNEIIDSLNSSELTR